MTLRGHEGTLEHRLVGYGAASEKKVFDLTAPMIERFHSIIKACGFWEGRKAERDDESRDQKSGAGLFGRARYLCDLEMAAGDL